MDFQFYPTPIALAQKAWAKFKNKDFSRVLEPSAGQGDLLKAIPNRVRPMNIDACEIDMGMHDTLRKLDSDHKVSVVGFDFLAMNQGAMYSHVIMNPPFAHGVQHVLHAWEIIWDGEIVAILNAETLRNPFSAERRQLNELIARHGSVEFIEGGFAGTDALRKTNVDVALVWLKKTSEVGSFVVADILTRMKKDEGPVDEPQFVQHDLIIPATMIENFVAMFDQAVAAARESVKYQSRAEFLGNRIGLSMSEMMGERNERNGESASQKATTLFSNIYMDLKDRAWTNVLRTADFTSKLSSGAQKKVHESFEQIKQMQFTTQNVHGFLQGILESQGSIQNDMVCEAFDLITRYHSDNLCYYKGWKSNDKHRTLGMRLKTTRFVIPRCGESYFRNSITYGSRQMMRDIDKVFSLLDGVEEPEVSLSWLFDKQMDMLCSGERLSSSYFDVRFYPGVGTVHFFPKRKDLMDRLNLIVGKQRQWLPPNVDAVSKPFWQQYERAESMDRQLRAKGAEAIMQRLNWMDESEKAVAYGKMNSILTEVHEKNGISDFSIECKPETTANQQMLLLAA